MPDEKFFTRLQNDRIQTRAIPVVPKSYDENTRSFECVAATENKVRVLDWERWEIIDEVLLMSGYSAPAVSPDKCPLLDTHMRFSVDTILGSARDWQVRDKELICRAYLSSVEEGLKAETKIREGHIDSVSIGYTVDQSVWVEENMTTTINGQTFVGPLKVATQWTRRELSLVPIGADEYAKFRSIRALQLGLPESASDEEIRKQLNNTSIQLKRKDTAMEEELKKKQEELERRQAQLEEDIKNQREEAVKVRNEAEEAKQKADDAQEIMATASRFAQVEGIYTMARESIEQGRSAKDFMKDVLEKVGSNPAPVAPDDPARASIVSLSTFIKPWERRAVKYLNSIVLEKKGSHERAQVLRRELTDEVTKMSNVQKDDELREAAQLIVISGISRQQQYRLMSSLSAGAGQNLVPTPMLAEIFILVEKWGVARRYFRAIPMTADTLKLDSLVTEGVAYWVTQGSGITASDLAFGQGTLTARKLAAIGAWTNELSEDAAIALLPVVIDSFARAIAKQEDLAAFIGDGTATYGSFTGLLNFAGNVVTMDDGKTAFTDANANDFKDLRDAVNIDFRQGAYYFLSPAIVSQLEGLRDLQGRYIYREPAAGLPAMLWGYPIADSVGINALDLTSAAATKFAAFGNPKNMLMGMKRDIEILASREGVLDNGSGAISFNALQADGEILRLTERVGIQGVLANGFSVLKTAAA